MNETVRQLYGKKLRVRTCGLCIHEDRLLMINHTGLATGDFWAPPGGGVELGESAEACLEREFLEETGLKIVAGDFLFACEFIKDPLHAIELFFEVEWQSGKLITGRDPEADHQIIRQAQFMTWQEIKNKRPDEVHGIFRYSPEPAKIRDLRGYFKL